MSKTTQEAFGELAAARHELWLAFLEVIMEWEDAWPWMTFTWVLYIAIRSVF